VVRDALRDAIDAGVFQPGEQMPSTKELSEQMSVSLVTAHRALQELVTSGILQRSQGKGTFVRQKYVESRECFTQCRLGLVFHREASLADFYHSQVLEGVRQAAQSLNVDLILLRFGEDVRKECNGYLLVNPLPHELNSVAKALGKKQPTLVVGAKSDAPNVCSVDVDNVDLAKIAAAHLASLGHKRIAFVGGDDQVSNNRDRWLGFSRACIERGIKAEAHVVKGASWRLDEKERATLIAQMSGLNRPTAIFAAGYYFALDVYACASISGLKIPEDLSVLAVDDPPSAVHLSPPLTTLRQPLVQLGHAAVTALAERIHRNETKMENRTLKAELVIRRSSAALSRKL
jgi:LacI family transcriptional regulator